MKVYISVIIIIVLILSTFGENSSSTYPLVELEKLNNSEKEQLFKIFYPEKIERIDNYLEGAYKKFGFNGNVLVAYDGEIILQESYGYEDFSSKTLLEDNSAFQLASVSKQFTAISILILKERGLIDLESDIRKYLLEIPYENITVKNLLQHTSGLSNYLYLLDNKWKPGKMPTNKDLIAYLSENKPDLYFTPGKRHDYSNTGYAVLASIVESVTGKRFGDFVRDNIFVPLEMNESFVYSAAYEDFHASKLNGYVRSRRSVRVHEVTMSDGIVGDKSVYSTTGDLFKWDQALYNNTLITGQTLNEAFTSGKIGTKRQFPYGYGFRIKDVDDKRVIYHKGRWEGFRTSFSRYIEDKNTIIVLNNTSCSAIHKITKEIEAIANEEVQIAPEYKIILTALSYGYEYGIDQCNLVKESHPGMKFNREIFKRTEEILTLSHKNQLASIITKISSSI